MGYLEKMYGKRDKEFVEGFLAAMETYAVYNNGRRFIGSSETELKEAMVAAVNELSSDPELFMEDISFYTY